MKMKKIAKIFTVALVGAAILSGCSSGGDKETKKGAPKKDGVEQYTAFMATSGKEIPSDNRLHQRIGKEFGRSVQVSWLTGQTAKERVGVMIAGKKYPDFIDGGEATGQLVKAGALVPLEKYILETDDYPNIKKLFTDQQWNLIKNTHKGHIYYIPQFSSTNKKSMATQQDGEAFWIQKRVLEWAKYPKIETIDQYFDLIDDYLAANPTDKSGQKNIGFEVLSDDTKYFCLENPPQFLAGYPNDGKAIIDVKTHKAKAYETTDVAKRYYKLLGEQYNKGVIDRDTFTMKYDQYISKLSSGNVIGMVDQAWNFIYTAVPSLVAAGKDDRTYVPLDLVMDKGTEPKYFGPKELNSGAGLGITVHNPDVKGSLKFIDDLLSQKGMELRNWGEKGVDYKVDDNGMFYHTEEQRKNNKNPDWVNKNMDSYSYFPGYGGLLPDGKNAVSPGEQPNEFKESLSDYDKKFLKAYGWDKWTDGLHYYEKNQVWYPIWSATNSWSASEPYAIAMQKMDDVKKAWLPKVVMAKPSEYKTEWDKYMKEFKTKTNYQTYLDELTKEVQRRIDNAK